MTSLNFGRRRAIYEIAVLDNSFLSDGSLVSKDVGVKRFR